MSLKIVILLMIATPLTGLVIAFLVPLVFGAVGPSQDHFETGLVWHEQGRFENAIEEYGKAIELKADFAQAYAKKGEAWFAIGRSDQALWDYNEAIAHEKQMLLKIATREYPGFKGAIAQAHFGRAVIYEAQGYSLKANTEAARAKELGYDPVLIEAAIGRPLP